MTFEQYRGHPGVSKGVLGCQWVSWGNQYDRHITLPVAGKRKRKTFGFGSLSVS